MTYLTFAESTYPDKVYIFNKDEVSLGRLEKVQVGQWQFWCLFLEPDCYLSASCLDEVREKTKQLNARKR